MTDIVDRERRSELIRRLRGRGTTPEMAVRRVSHRTGCRFRLRRKGPLDSPILLFRLAYNRLLHPNMNDNGLNSGLRSRGEKFSGAAVRRPCHTDGGGSGGASVGLSCVGNDPILMSEQCKCSPGLGEPAFKLDMRWYLHD